MWAHVVDMSSTHQSMTVINDGPGKDKPILWYKGGGICIWNYAGLNNCLQVLKETPLCAFVVWYVLKRTKEKRETVVI